ncbi:ParB/RepB/Spo0J family partition protein [Ornithinibacillus californiensis]|uniref:ParB/RepB/Spo0J family partition protein n=1 Tax=Ornithinibacillus californiensis TaxID=161536 RepID=UPI00064DC8EE|nr:ParB/RepB/Spo0J family partition protein [Ornithinibacillus californiensis]
MNYQLKKIKLSDIRLETDYRNTDKDLDFILDIKRNGLQYALLVEEEGNNQYVLVDGYRRYYALEYIGITSVNCFVEVKSTEEERIIKRLRKEFHTKRRTAYQLERMINRLLENEKYHPRLIASLCNVTENTITKYIKGSSVDPDWLRRGEMAGVGRHAFTDIHNLKVNEQIKHYLADKYINREITRNSIDAVKKTTKLAAFDNITDEKIKDCIDEIIFLHSKSVNKIENVVNKYSLKAIYNISSHTFMHYYTMELFDSIEEVLRTRNYFDYLSDYQKDELNEAVRKLQQILNPPINWAKFPDEKVDNYFEEKDNLDH